MSSLNAIEIVMLVGGRKLLDLLNQGSSNGLDYVMVVVSIIVMVVVSVNKIKKY